MNLKSVCLFLLCALMIRPVTAQSLPAALRKALDRLAAQPSMKHASISLCVRDARTGAQVYEWQSETGLAFASVQKVFSSIAAYELLGPEFRFHTDVMLESAAAGEDHQINLRLTGFGDPSLGSFRYASTAPALFIQHIRDSLLKYHLQVSTLLLDDSRYPVAGIPRGWIWEDIGNYYGAGVWALNWRENQFDLSIRPGKKPGEPARAPRFRRDWFSDSLVSELETGPAGSGDHAYLFPALNGNDAYLLGTVPLADSFSISGALQSPYRELGSELAADLHAAGCMAADSRLIHLTRETISNATEKLPQQRLLWRYYSPSLDSLTYFFLRKSINLYGEAFAKALAYQAGLPATTESGVETIRKFWMREGMEDGALQLVDGSGLSPQNRVTARAVTDALLFARKQKWFEGFYRALPEYNGMKMKSGSINGVRAFAGYHKAASGKEYTFAIAVNNFSGPAGAAIQSLYRVLDLLK